MYRVTLHNLFYDSKIYFRRHRGKFVIAIILAITGFCLGVSGAITVYDAAILNKFNNFSVILLISGKKTFIGYFIGRIIQIACLSLLMLLLSFRLLTAVLNFVLIFFFCFFSARNIAISIVVLKVGFLPVSILCLIPSIIVYSSIFCSFCILSIDYSFDFGYYYSINIFCGLKLIPVCVPHFIILSLTILSEAILVNILTLGLSI